MPIIKSAQKRVKQALVKQARNYNVRSALRKAIRAVIEAVGEGKKTESEKALQNAYKLIDTAVKKNILQKNTAARRKSSLAKQVATLSPQK
jgi:small subunit ribosomal protein S20